MLGFGNVELVGLGNVVGEVQHVLGSRSTSTPNILSLISVLVLNPGISPEARIWLFSGGFLLGRSGFGLFFGSA